MIIRHGSDNNLKIDWKATLESIFFPRLYKMRIKNKELAKENEILYKSDKVRILDANEINSENEIINIEGTLVFKGNYINLSNNKITTKTGKDIPAIELIGGSHYVIANNYIKGVQNEETT